MPTVIGKVNCLQVQDDLGFMGILENTTNTVEYFVIWNNPGDPSAFTRVLQTMWLSLLKESLQAGNQVELNFDSNFILLSVRIDVN